MSQSKQPTPADWHNSAQTWLVAIVAAILVRGAMRDLAAVEPEYARRAINAARVIVGESISMCREEGI